MDNPLDVVSCQTAIEAREQLGPKKMAELDARIVEDAQLFCEGSDAEVAGRVKKLLSPPDDDQPVAGLDPATAPVYARARSCLHLGMKAMGLLGNHVPGMPMILTAPAPDVPRGLTLVAKSCALLPQLPSQQDPPGKGSANTWYRAPGVLACTIMGDAYALGVLEYDLKRASSFYTAACSAEREVLLWNPSEVTCEQRPCDKEIEAAQKRYDWDHEASRWACKAGGAVTRAEECPRVEGCDLAAAQPKPVVLIEPSWAELGAKRVHKVNDVIVNAKASAAANTASGAYKDRLQKLAAEAAKLAPSEQVNAVARELSRTPGSREEQATVGLAIYAPILLAALPRIAEQGAYAAVGAATRNLMDAAVATDARWAEVRAALVRFRSEAGKNYVQKAERAGGRVASAAVYAVFADMFDAKVSDPMGLRQSFRNATQIAVTTPAKWGDCGFLTGATASSGGPIGPRTEAELELTSCQKGMRAVTSELAGREGSRETRRVRKSFTREVPNCHTVYLRTCTGKDSSSCYTSGSRQECNGTKTESYEQDVDVSVDSQSGPVAPISVQSRERFIDIDGRVIARAGAQQFALPFAFHKALAGEGSFDSLVSDANHALYLVLADSIRAPLRAGLAKEALAAADAAARAGKYDDAEDGYLTVLGLGSAYTPSMSTFFEKRWALDGGSVRSMVELAQR
jgi:hypothetical protein